MAAIFDIGGTRAGSLDPADRGADVIVVLMQRCTLHKHHTLAGFT